MGNHLKWNLPVLPIAAHGLAYLFAFAAAVLWFTTEAAHAADHAAYREVLVAGDPARLSALIAADQQRLPVDENGVTVLHRALHV